MPNRQQKDRSHRFGKLQLRIMRLLWRQRMNARAITDELNSERSEAQTAHSTVQTLLRKLEEKGAISHEVKERTFIFYPLVREENAMQKATQDFVQRIFNGSVPGLVSYLLKSEKLSPDELREIRKLVQEKGKVK
ncbi:MAG: BlaI/MecI/CopY family transcriptional regulator [Methylacidiphilales bacterium]|nr:BlaI/MecI/CopY family transcriptional regulator [Candidatus Methylacidiphilales bacterium]